jgi:hypothetical protein
MAAHLLEVPLYSGIPTLLSCFERVYKSAISPGKKGHRGDLETWGMIVQELACTLLE